jgi:hypothetical protein
LVAHPVQNCILEIADFGKRRTEIPIQLVLPADLNGVKEQILLAINKHFDMTVYYETMDLLRDESIITTDTLGQLRGGVVKVRFSFQGSEQFPQLYKSEFCNEKISVCFGPDSLLPRRDCLPAFFYSIEGLSTHSVLTRNDRPDERFLRIAESCKSRFVWFSHVSTSPEFTLSPEAGTCDSPAVLTFRNATIFHFTLPTRRLVSVFFPDFLDVDECADRFANEYMNKQFRFPLRVTVQADGPRHYRVLLPQGDIVSGDPHAVHIVAPDRRRIDWQWPTGTLPAQAIEDIVGILDIPLDCLLYQSPRAKRPLRLALLADRVKNSQELAGMVVDLILA